MSGEDRFDEEPLVGAGGFEPPEEPTTEEPVKRARVSRQFQARVDFRDVELPDWEFISKVIELFQPYATPSDEVDTFLIRGRDSRGSYSAEDLDAFREEHAERGEDLENFSVQVYGKNDHGLYGLSVHYAKGYGFADLDGGDEVMVNGIAARVEKLAQAATARAKAKEEAALKAKQRAALRALEETQRDSEPVPVTVVDPAPKKTSLWNHPWSVQIGGGVIAALIVALVVWLISSH